MIPSSIYTIIDSILMLCGVKTFSDKLLFDQKDLPVKVNKTTRNLVKRVTFLQSSVPTNQHTTYESVAISSLKPVMCLSKTMYSGVMVVYGTYQKSQRLFPRLLVQLWCLDTTKKCQNKATEKKEIVKMFWRSHSMNCTFLYVIEFWF